METTKIISTVFEKMCNSYENIFEQYYPSHGSNGFTERNLTFYFSHNYLSINCNSIIWQEVPIDNKKHFDTLIIDNDNNNKSIIIIEAKRLQSTDKFNEIEADYKKIIENWCQVNKISEEPFKAYKKYVLLLADIWILNEAVNKTKLKNDFEEFKFDKSLNKQKSKEIRNMENYSKEKYYLMYNLYSIDEAHPRCTKKH